MLSPDSMRNSAGSAGSEELWDDETAVTEITFLPDGRICLFGASRQVLELLGSLELGDPSLDSRLAALRRPDLIPPVE